MAEFHLTVSREAAEFSRIREVLTPENTETNREIVGTEKIAEHCPYCNSNKFVKRGLRKKKLENVQLYLCGNCKRTFTAQFIKGKHF